VRSANNWRRIAISLTDPDFGRTNGASLCKRLISSVDLNFGDVSDRECKKAAGLLDVGRCRDGIKRLISCADREAHPLQAS
jgi:hypothetical protein